MFSIFVIAFLATGGGPVAAGQGRAVYATIEACQAEMASTDPTDLKSLAAFKLAIEQHVGKDVRVAASCAEVDQEGHALHDDQLPSKTPEQPL